MSEVKARAKLNQKSILDLGFSTSEHRTRTISELRTFGIEVEVHFVTVPTELRWQRVEKRNQEKSDTYVMNVDRSMFDFMESIFEHPPCEEGATVKLIS